MSMTIIIPAFNEEAYIGPTLDAVRAAADHLSAGSDDPIEIIVVDNDSEDGTVPIARIKGATVVHEPVRNIARARNTGARHAAGDVLVFVDADVSVPRTLFHAIHRAMSDPGCLGGGVDVDYRPRRPFVRAYLRVWRVLSRITAMVQGATQFCRKETFERAGGYDERAWIGEDVAFYWALRRLARREHRTIRFLQRPRVRPSCRRFDKWPLWRILLWTNPLVIALLRRRESVWTGWYSEPVR